MTAVLAVILGLFSGFIGWILSEFVAKPVRRGIDLAYEFKTALIEFANVSARDNEGGKPTGLNDDEELRLREAERTYRNLAARIIAFTETDKTAAWLLKKVLFDAEYAGTALMQLSNNIGTYGDGRKVSVQTAKEALRVKLLLNAN